MLPDQKLLRIPGPTPIPPSVKQAMSRPMIGHRSQEASELIQSIRPGLGPLFGTKEEVMIVTGSGTSGLETAVVNAAAPDDEVLVIVTGAFGDRFAKICEAYDLKTHRMDVEWGKAARPEQVEQYLKSHPDIRVVFATFCETSTGVLNPIGEIGKVVQHSSDALFVVDGVSAIGGVEANMDDWGVDIFVTGSQKALMLPAGLALIAVSERAWKKIESNPQHRFYLDLKKYKEKIEGNSTPFTPALSLLFGLRQVLELFEEEGLKQVFNRHKLMMNMTREAFRALQLPLFTSDQDASPTVTAVQPDRFSAEEFRQVIRKEFGLSVAGGQQDLKGQIFRVGHMGYSSPADVLQTISLVEIGLKTIGARFDFGQGVAAAQQVYTNWREQ
ncbi:aspartate aminotransferase-like enzyme [Melghiribacillus thermohalophilus]|uniref:Aspartate aminotransferase-like enzyme n=1 Tax=Melghiribacillus thermohalophilus TaxID=1324956 RepID=A0A4R3N3J0_9BACI|nr:alanine--glyoxylate aminotransferase family protein [Melghiribacillus thermohalophilus]TCT23314.1 aspartate aminotransferase-like enzyme [Melghiribacillus thermohalophilus]